MLKDFSGKICVIGSHGLIGSSITAQLSLMGFEVVKYPEEDVLAVFNFSGPTHIQFENSSHFFMRETINQHISLLEFCSEKNIPYAWPSSALVYEDDKDTPLKYAKLAMEDIQKAYTAPTLSCRIFPVYGPGEKNKGKYKTFIYQSCEQMKKGERPTIYGDGEQKRDFIYVDDLASNIVWSVIEGKTGIVDFGHGKPISFNSIINLINYKLNTNIKPIYIDYPINYSPGIYCKNPVKQHTLIEKGIENILESI